MNQVKTIGYLVDTSVLLRFLGGLGGISDGVKGIFEDKNARIYASAASFFEIAAKKAMKKAKIPDHFPEAVEKSGFELLPVRADHSWKTLRLPYHHTDPYDRLLLAQAVCDNLTIITACPHFDAYGVPVIRT